MYSVLCEYVEIKSNDSRKIKLYLKVFPNHYIVVSCLLYNTMLLLFLLKVAVVAGRLHFVKAGS